MSGHQREQQQTRRQLHGSNTLGTARHDGGAQPTTTKQKLVLNTEMLSNEALRKIQPLGDQHSHRDKTATLIQLKVGFLARLRQNNGSSTGYKQQRAKVALLTPIESSACSWVKAVSSAPTAGKCNVATLSSSSFGKRETTFLQNVVYFHHLNDTMGNRNTSRHPTRTRTTKYPYHRLATSGRRRDARSAV